MIYQGCDTGRHEGHRRPRGDEEGWGMGGQTGRMRGSWKGCGALSATLKGHVGIW